MIRPSGGVPVYLYAQWVDMRKSIDGLAALVECEMALSPFHAAYEDQGAVFVASGTK